MKMMKKLTNLVCSLLLVATIVPVYSMDINLSHMNPEVIDIIDVENASYTFDDIKWYVAAAGVVVFGACVCDSLYTVFVNHIVRKVIKELDAREAFLKKAMALREEYQHSKAIYKYFGCWNSYV